MLTDRLTRGTYLFDNGEGKPGVICLTYSWMGDAMKMLPLPVEKRVRLALDALKKIYPTLDIEKLSVEGVAVNKTDCILHLRSPPKTKQAGKPTARPIRANERDLAKER